MVTVHLNPKIERITEAAVSISSDHSAIHEGEGFSTYVSSTSLANNGTLLIELTTPALKYLHLKQYIPWLNGGPARFEIIESPTLTPGVTPLVPKQRNRNSAAVSGTTCASNPTGISGGTELENILFGGGTGIGTSSFAQNKSLDIEFVLKPNTTYLFRLTNLSGGVLAAHLWLFWYEENSG